MDGACGARGVKEYHICVCVKIKTIKTYRHENQTIKNRGLRRDQLRHGPHHPAQGIG